MIGDIEKERVNFFFKMSSGNLLKNCLSVVNHFVGLALKGLRDHVFEISHKICEKYKLYVSNQNKIFGSISLLSDFEFAIYL